MLKVHILPSFSACNSLARSSNSLSSTSRRFASAAGLVVEIVEQYLAEYRPLLREDTKCRQALIEVLDLFVQAGWPSARRITYRLEDIFR